MNKPDDSILELIDSEDDLEYEEAVDEPDAAFWDEFYREKREQRENFTVEKKDDGIKIKIKSQLPKIRTN